MPLLGDSKSSSDMTPITTATTTTSSIFSEQLTASTFWLLGVLVSICLVLLALMGILVGRYRWWRRRLNVFYAAGSEGAFTDYRAQYLLRLSFERDPTKVALRRRHTDDCQVWLRLSYEDGPRDGLTVPLMINKIYQFNGKPTAQVLLRTQRPLLNARSLSASLFCVDGCPARRNAEEDAAKSKTNSRSRSCSSDLPPPPPPPPGQPPRSLDGQLFASLQAFTASLQAVPSRYSLSTKVLVLGAEPRSYFVLSGGQNNRRRCLMEHERTYSLAIESRQQIDYHPLRAAVTCPSDGLVVFNYLAAALTFLLLAAGEVQFQVVGAAGGDGGGDEVLWPLLLVVLPALVGALFLLSGHYLFVTHLQDRLLGRSLGRSTGAWLLHYGLLTVLTVFGLLCCLGAVTLIAAGVDIAAGGGGGGGGGHHDHHSSTTSSSSSSSSITTEKDSGSKTPSSSAKHHPHHPHHLNIASLTTFLLVALSWAVLFAIEGLLALLDHFFRCFNGVLSGGSFCACCCCCCWCCGFGFCGCSSSCCDDPEESCPRLRNLPATSTAPTEEFGRRGGGRKGGRKGGGKKGGKRSRGKRKGRNSSSK